jgi:hypothetical protein
MPQRTWSVENRAWLVTFQLEIKIKSRAKARILMLYVADKVITTHLSKATRFVNFDLALTEVKWWQKKAKRDANSFYQTASMQLEPITIAGGLTS